MARSLRIRTQLLLMTGAVFLLFSIPMAIAIGALYQTQQRFTSFIEVDDARLAAFNEMYAQGLQSGQALRNILLDPANRKAYDNLSQAGTAFDGALRKANSLSDSRAELAPLLANIENLARRQAQIRATLLDEVRAGKIDDARALLNKEETPAWRELRQLLLDSIQQLNKDAGLTETTLAATASAKRTQIIGFGLVSLVALLAISWLIGRNLLRQIGGEPAVATGIANKIAEGDLSSSIPLATGDNTSLFAAMKRVSDAISAMTADADRLAKAAVVGKLATRADATQHRGDYRRIVEGVNRTIATLVGHLDSMPAPAMIIDQDFNVQYMNTLGAKVGGKTPEQVAGSKCFEHFKTEDCHTERCACRQAMLRQLPSSSATVARPAAGLTLDIEYTGVPVKDETGRTTRRPRRASSPRAWAGWPRATPPSASRRRRATPTRRRCARSSRPWPRRSTPASRWWPPWWPTPTCSPRRPWPASSPRGRTPASTRGTFARSSTG
jgi:methyl-accepting chemotaxis protein